MAASLRHSLSMTSGGSSSRRHSFTAISTGEQAAVAAAAAASTDSAQRQMQMQMQLQDEDRPSHDSQDDEDARDGAQQQTLQQYQEVVRTAAALQQVQRPQAAVSRAKSAPNLVGLIGEGVLG